MEKYVKRPPNKKLALAVAMLILAASTMLSRPVAAPSDPIYTLNAHFLGGR
jgi:hypothetical protein